MGQRERTAKWKASDPVGFYRSQRSRTQKYMSSPEGRAANLVATRRYREMHRDELRDKARARRVELRALLVDAKSRPCMDCRGSFPAVCMDFHHRPGEAKRFEVSRMVSSARTPTLMIAEIAKCDLVCANCHRLRTASRHRAGETAVPRIVEPLTDATFCIYVPPVPMEQS